MRLAPSKPDRFVVECVLQALRKRQMHRPPESLPPAQIGGWHRIYVRAAAPADMEGAVWTRVAPTDWACLLVVEGKATGRIRIAADDESRSSAIISIEPGPNVDHWIAATTWIDQHAPGAQEPVFEPGLLEVPDSLSSAVLLIPAEPGSVQMQCMPLYQNGRKQPPREPGPLGHFLSNCDEVLVRRGRRVNRSVQCR